ncbi:hypothetical protein SAMN05421688_3053 [Poseidonocella pacifica]|uniref:Uncharacterized protein n=1 Tax=Poseidonocella pacifica TaxID=871651 RepID=A0A1I0YHH6_9RHOB|nr:hypothetical protein [Poseidonocella pacifica]SFB12196.1 hypothetical protein SAMN05421688_3053 [Poseidonocella pacifica]
MAERALTRDAVLQGLQDIRLPADAPGGFLAELLVALGAGLFFALLLAILARAVLRFQPKARPRTLSGRIADLRGLGPERQALGLLALVKQRRPEVYARYARDLYQADGMPSVEALERELAACD